MSLLNLLKTAAPYHLLAYSVVLGTTTWQSFGVGIQSFRVLPREHFSKLQGRLFPIYFPIQALCIGAILLTLPFKVQRFGKIALYTALGTSLLNTIYVGPRSTRILAERDELARAEGIDARDPNGSSQLKAYNAEFGKLHGISVLSNMGTLLSLLAYGLVIASHIV